MKHGITFPFTGLETVNGQTFEKLPLPLEISLYRREKQALAEAARAPQKVEHAIADKTVDILRLVYIDKPPLTNCLETGHTDRITLFLHISASNWCRYAKLKIFPDN